MLILNDEWWFGVFGQNKNFKQRLEERRPVSNESYHSKSKPPSKQKHKAKESHRKTTHKTNTIKTT
jgi:hypothetical protein